MLLGDSECLIGVNWFILLFCPAKKVATCNATSLWMKKKKKKGAASRVAVLIGDKVKPSVIVRKCCTGSAGTI